MIQKIQLKRVRSEQSVKTYHFLFKILFTNIIPLGIIVDKSFQKRNCIYFIPFFNELGATGIRLDIGFDGLKESQLTFNKFGLEIEINMSSGTKYVDNIMSYKPNKEKLIGSHNFYPMRYSGLSLEHFLKCCKQFKDYGLRTAAFVSSNVALDGPWPIMDGLCSLEMHRDLPISAQVKHLMMIDDLDDIIIANSFASEDELKSISELKNFLELKIIFNKEATELEKK